MKRATAALVLALRTAVASRQAPAQSFDTPDIRSCAAIESDAQRLACYDQAAGRATLNKDESRPFRETDYEPEALLAFDTHYEVLGWQGRLLGIGVNHQSNGRSNPLSRSWNRVIHNATSVGLGVSLLDRY